MTRPVTDYGRWLIRLHIGRSPLVVYLTSHSDLVTLLYGFEARWFFISRERACQIIGGIITTHDGNLRR